MIVQIAPDARKIMPYRKPQGGEVFAVADSGEHQQLWSLNRARRQHDFPMRLHHDVAACGARFDRRCPPPIQHDAGGLRAGQHHQIRSAERRPQQGGCRGLAHTAADRELSKRHPLAVRAVQVIPVGETQAGERIKEREVERIRARDAANVHRTAAAVVHAGSEILVVFAPAKVRQHLPVAPAGRPSGGPRVIVPRVPPEIDHAIDERRAAKAPPPRHGNPPTVELG